MNKQQRWWPGMEYDGMFPVVIPSPAAYGLSPLAFFPRHFETR